MSTREAAFVLTIGTIMLGCDETSVRGDGTEDVTEDPTMDATEDAPVDTITEDPEEDAPAGAWELVTDEWSFHKIAAHPTEADTVAGIEECQEWYPEFYVRVSRDGAEFVPVLVMTFTPTTGFIGWAHSIAFDLDDGRNLVAAMAGDPPSSPPEALVHAWSTDTGGSFSHSTTAFTDPWPADEMRFISGSPSEVVWRAGASFHFSSTLGASYDRTHTLTLPTGCDEIMGFDVPSDDHDTVAIWCWSGTSHICDVTTSSCTDIPVDVGIVFLTYAPSDPSRMLLMSDCDCGFATFLSTDSGASTSRIYSFHGYKARFDPRDPDTFCLLHHLTGEFACTADMGESWRPMNTTYDLPDASQLRDFDFAADGGIWGATLNEIVRHPPI